MICRVSLQHNFNLFTEKDANLKCKQYNRTSQIGLIFWMTILLVKRTLPTFEKTHSCFLPVLKMKSFIYSTLVWLLSINIIFMLYIQILQVPVACSFFLYSNKWIHHTTFYCCSTFTSFLALGDYISGCHELPHMYLLMQTLRFLRM